MSYVQLKIAVPAILVCFMLMGFASAQNSSSSGKSLSKSDQQFLTKMAKGSQGEVQISQMVASKASNQQVKEFAQRMVHDHTALNNQIKQVMEKHGMSMPQPLTAEQQQLKNKLQSMSGEKLERAYMSAQVKDHEKDVQEVSKQAQAANQLQSPDPDVSELAQEARPVLTEHLQLAKKVASEIGVTTTASR